MPIDWELVRRKREEFWNSSPVYKLIYERMKKQGYHFIGTIGVVKRCHWTKEALINKRFCYKCLWYGIESHRCIQMSPVAAWCWLRCQHCWRIQPEDIGMHWDETRVPVVDDPEVIAEESIRVHRQIVSGFKGNPKADLKMVEEAMKPKHVAISLTGEPTLYPRLGELIREYHKRNMTTFLVTSGVRPDVLANLGEEPTQLYLSLESWNKEKFTYFNRPVVPRAWELIMDTIDLFPSFKCPTVYRLTIIKGYNDTEEALKGFAKLIERGNPTYVEVKAYMYVGYSRGRLKPYNMPTHDEIREYAKKLSEITGYTILSESIPSRIVLLSRIKEPIRHGKGCPDGVKHPEKYAWVMTHEYEEATGS
ncbi:MAG: 4-demethylwyosine synthase TYW1 [Staphylothermus sp.]|nr:4-demethylwyosine synthase TYW1 [Staphylothermus sp.]